MSPAVIRPTLTACCALALALSAACASTSKPAPPGAKQVINLTPGTRATVTCPGGGLPTDRLKDERTVEFVCPDGEKPIVEIQPGEPPLTPTPTPDAAPTAR
jgi:hypothetical protein